MTDLAGDHLEVLDLGPDEVLDDSWEQMRAVMRINEADDEAKAMTFAGATDAQAEVLRRSVRLQDRWEQAWVRFFDRQWERRRKVLDAKVRSTQFRRGTTLWDPPGDTPLIDRLGVLVDAEAWKREVAEDAEPLLRDLYVEAVEALEVMQSKALTGALLAKVEAFVQRWLTHIGWWSDSIAGAVAAVLRSEATEDVDMTARVVEHAERVSRLTASRVAISLATGSVNQAQYEAMEEVPEVIQRRWYSARDTRVRPGHRLATGQTVDMGEPFEIADRKGVKHSMMYPGDISAPRDVWIHCRCLVLGISRTSAAIWDGPGGYTDSFGRLRGAEKSYTPASLGLTVESKARPWREDLHPRDPVGRFRGRGFSVFKGDPVEGLAEHVGRPWHDDDWRDVTVSPKFQAAAADAYLDLPDIDEAAIPAYKAFVEQLDEQYEVLTKDLGIKVEVVKTDPYPDVEAMIADLRKNKRIKVLATASTPPGHPFLTDAENDRFRAVHDAFGHAGTGRGFDRHGEEAAYQAHANMFDALARRALATETRGQNAVLITRGDFPEQKVALLPEHLTERRGGMKTKSADEDNHYDEALIHHTSAGRHPRKQADQKAWDARRRRLRDE